MRPLSAAFFALALLAAPALADDAKEAKPTGDLAKFQGTWATKIGPNNGLDANIIIEGKTALLVITGGDGQKFELAGEIKLDEAAKPSKAITWTKFKSPSGEELPENPGIYKFENDDTITLCNGGPGNERPKDFKEEEGKNISTMKRVGKAKDKKDDHPTPKAGVENGGTAK